jgi:hypothetical protein
MTGQAKITVTAEDRASRVLQQVRGQLASTSSSAAELAASAGLIGPAFATLASAAGLVAFVKNVADAVDALNDVADATGASIESLSGLERVARLNGGTLQDVSGILVKFNAALAQSANPASDAAGVFKALGLSAKELQQIDPAVALQRTAVALAGFADDGNKARITQELFGKSIREAAPFLKDLAEAGELNATVTREQAEQAERFNKALAALRVNVQDASRSLLGEMAVSIQRTVANVTTATASFGGLAAAIQAVLSGATQFKDSPAKGLAEYNKQLADIDARIAKVRDGSDGFAGRFSQQRIEALQKERGEVAKVADYYRTLNNAGSAGQGRGGIGGSLPSLPTSTKPKAVTAPKTEIDESTQALARYVDQLQKEADKAADLTERQKALNLLRSIGATGQIPQVRQLVLALAEESDERERGLAFARAMTTELQRQADEQRGLDDALNSFAGRTADALKRAQTTRLEARLAAGEAFSPEELDRIVRGIGGIKDAAEQTFNASNKSLERFAENVQDALGSTVEATLRGDVDSIGRLWGNLLIKLAAEAIAADLGNALFGDLLKASGGAAGGAGLFGAIFGSLFGLGTGKAAGGTVQPWSMQRVNESGVEMFSRGGQDWLLAGPRGGKVTPNSALAGGGAVNVVQNITVGSQVSRNDVMAAMQVAKIQTVRAVADARRRTYAEGAA